MKKLLTILALIVLVMTLMAPAQAVGNTKVILDFETDIQGAIHCPWDAGDSLTFSKEATDDYVGAGALKIHTDDTIGLANIWYGVDFPVDMTGAADYQGMCLRIDARSIATVDQTAQMVFCLSKGEGAEVARLVPWVNVKFYDLAGNDVTPTGLDKDGNPKRTAIAGTAYSFLPYMFNGWVFCEFAESNPVAGYDIADIDLTIGLSDWCFDAVIDTVGKDVYIDEFALYKGTDYAAVVSELGVAFDPNAPTAPPIPTPEPTASPKPSPTAVPTATPTATEAPDAEFPWLYAGIGAGVVVILAVVIILLSKKKKA